MQILPDIEKLKRWREERCWSQEHLADLAGISLGAKDGSYAMLWPSIWWTVGMAGHALTLALALIVQRFGKSGV